MSNATITTPFTVLIDTAESNPFAFTDLVSDAKDNNHPLEVSTAWCCLGRYPHSIGDYSLYNYTDKIGIERKSIEDVWATVLGYQTDYEKKNGLASRRERFECELSNLARLESSAVIVEASLEECIRDVPAWGTKPVAVLRKSFHRSVIAMQQDYRVPWLFCGSRSLAEVTAFRWLERFWKKRQEQARQERLLKAQGRLFNDAITKA